MATIQKNYLYHTYRNGVYLGELQNVVSDFGYSQDINSGAAQLEVQIALDADVSDQALLILDAEDGTDLAAEDGTTLLTTERALDVVGSSHDNIQIRNGNQIKVYEISDTYPNGKIMFTGTITNWTANFGGNEGGLIKFSVLSDGADLANYVITTGAVGFVTQNTDNATSAIDFNGKSGAFDDLIQTFNPASATKLASLDLKMGAATGFGFFVYIYQMLGSQPNLGIDTLLGTSSENISVSIGSQTVATFTFATPIQLQGSTTYYLVVSCDQNFAGSAGANVSYQSTNPYASGQVWQRSFNGVSTVYTSQSGWDLYFVLYGAGNTTSSFTTLDPTTILKQIVDNYVGQGGLTNYAVGSTDLTGYTTSYTFVVATTLEGIQKCLELAPADWYWYVDVSTDVLYFKETLTTATYTLVKGLHITELNLNATIENMINDLYYTGGAVAGTNLFSRYQNAASRSSFGSRLDRKTDNRVTLQPTLDTLGNAEVNDRKNEQYITTTTIVDGIAGMDITLFKPGQTIGFAGFGNFIDRLILQISRLDYRPSSTTLTLGVLPQRLNDDLGIVNNELDQLQTIANPTAPS